jgi:integrase
MSITQRAKNTYLVRVYVGRDPITKQRVEINETVYGSLSYARKREARLKAQKYSGQLLKSPRMTVDTLCKLFLESARHTLRRLTCYNYNALYTRYAGPYIGNSSIDNIKHSNLQQLFNLLLDPKEPDSNDKRRTATGLGLSGRTVKNLRYVLKGVFGYAVNNGLIAENPVNNTKVTARNKPMSNSLTIEEATAFVSVKDQCRYGNAFVFQLHTGLRNQELMALIWDDVDFDNGTLRVERACAWEESACVEIGPPKTEQSNRVIKLEPEQLALLRCQLEAQQGDMDWCRKKGIDYGSKLIKDWIKRERPRRDHLYTNMKLIFPKRDGEVPSSGFVREACKKLLRSAGIKNVENLRWYDLRHSHGSILYAEEVLEGDIADRMGHSKEVFMRTYCHTVRSKRSTPSRVFADLIPVQ